MILVYTIDTVYQSHNLYSLISIKTVYLLIQSLILILSFKSKMNFLNVCVCLCALYSDEKEDLQEPKIWYWQDRYLSSEEIEVPVGMDNNDMNDNDFHLTPDFSLVIKNFIPMDEGLYKCHGSNGQDEESKYNYRLER